MKEACYGEHVCSRRAKPHCLCTSTWLPCPTYCQSIRETENALCLMLNQPAQSIARGTLEQQQLPAGILSTGIPLQLLSNRPDVKAAEMSLAASYYDTNSARAAFYPQITLSGSAGWTNSCRCRYCQSRQSCWLPPSVR